MNHDGSGDRENDETKYIGESNVPVIFREGEQGEMADGGEGTVPEIDREDEQPDGMTEDGTGRTMPSAIC
jgi:hypothetical protein